MAWRTLIGLEIHVELMTKYKVYCNCKNEFGGEVNTHVCPVCLGLPGALPVIDKECLEYGIKTGLAFNSEIAKVVRMDRKNYFYPDLVKGYQISQADLPLCGGGYLEINLPEGPKRINLERVHLEEDTGKQIHNDDGTTLLDFNRCGVPLIEIVSKPEISSAEEAKLFLDKLRSTIKYIGVSDVRMEEGSLRCDVNINVLDDERGLKSKITEVKNLNSFKSVVRTIEFEEKRHKELLEQGFNTDRETRRWDEVAGETILMRRKYTAEDYRFCYDGDLPPIGVDAGWLEEIRSSMPELPHAKKLRFINEYSLGEYDSAVLTQSRELANFFEDTLSHVGDSKLVANWMMGDVLRRLKEEDKEIDDFNITSKDLADLLNMVKDGKINNNTGKKVLKEMFETGVSPELIVKEQGLIQISDEGALEELVTSILAANPQSIEDYKNGKDRAVGFLMGQIMKETKGKANPQLVSGMLMEKLTNM
jgi:aspartyl-tRNA(Asn)/glutamyl-tRNA(Gln) amidotransferase subunit B